MNRQVVGTAALKLGPKGQLSRPVALSPRAAAAAQQMFKEHGKDLVAYAVVLGATYYDAEDLVQNAIIAYMIEVEERQLVVPMPVAWIRRVIKHDLYDRRRLARRHAELEQKQARLAEPVAPTGEEAMNFWESTQDVHAFLKRVPPKMRDVLTCIVADMKPSEIAVFLGRTPANIRQHLKRARDQYRPLMGAGTITSDTKEMSK